MPSQATDCKDQKRENLKPTFKREDQAMSVVDLRRILGGIRRFKGLEKILCKRGNFNEARAGALPETNSIPTGNSVEILTMGSSQSLALEIHPASLWMNGKIKVVGESTRRNHANVVCQKQRCCRPEANLVVQKAAKKGFT